MHEVFSSKFDFVIPDYQRPYSWGVEQAGQLLDDLLETLRREEEEPYFLGSVVLVKEEMSARAEVIDGQQRLTTLTIILACLRDLAEDDDLRAELRDYVREPGRIALGLSPKPRLVPRSRDALFFEKHVQTPGSTTLLSSATEDQTSNDAQQALVQNAVLLRDSLKSQTDDARTQLVQMILQRAFLVVVMTADLESAHRIFAVMNDRGLDLTASDIIKARVIGVIPEDHQAEYAQKWEDAEEQLGRDSFGDLFSHVRMLFAKQQQKLSVLRELDQYVLSEFLPARAGEFVDRVVVPYGKVFATVRDQSFTYARGADAVNAWLRRLAEIDNFDWQPVALWVIHRHANEPEAIASHLCALERLAASMMIRRMIASRRIQRYGALLTELEQGKGLGATAFELEPEERSDTISRLDGDVYQAARVRRYVLLRLDESLAGAQGVTYDHKIITIEHVLPQSPAADSEWREAFTEEERRLWTHRLANLVLLNRYKNSAAQNYDFETKKSRYFRGADGVVTFALTSQVLDAPKWTPETLQMRQRDLVRKLRETWNL